MRMLEAMKEAERSSRAYVWMTHKRFPGVRFYFTSTNDWKAVGEDGEIEGFTFTIDDLNDYGWEITYS